MAIKGSDEKREVLRKRLIATAFANALANRLTKEHGKDTGMLISHILKDWRIEGDEVIISMPDYAEYLEYGTPNPTTPEEILGWVERKIMPNVTVTGKNRKEKAKRIAKSLAKHITKYGPRPFPFIRTTIKEDLPGILAKYR